MNGLRCVSSAIMLSNRSTLTSISRFSSLSGSAPRFTSRTFSCETYKFAAMSLSAKRLRSWASAVDHHRSQQSRRSAEPFPVRQLPSAVTGNVCPAHR